MKDAPVIFLSNKRETFSLSVRKDRFMANKRHYFRLTKAERVSIEQGLNKHRSARSMARDLGRAPSSITDEIKRNRTIFKGPGKGEQVHEVPLNVCPKLSCWPYVCNGCNKYHYGCNRDWRCEYNPYRAQMIAEQALVESRRGINAQEEDFEKTISIIRADLSRGLSPEQICMGRAYELKVSPSTIYRWIAKGYAGMSNLDLRRKVGYKPRRKRVEVVSTRHGDERSYQAFLELSEEERAAVTEMDTVLGCKGDSQCILTLYLRPLKLQLCLLLEDKTQRSVTSVLDMLEGVLGTKLFHQMFGTILTDNGTEFANYVGIERSCLAYTSRCQVYYCDVRQSQQKAGCERNHVELRKILPKGRGIRFDALDKRDMAVLMSHLNSQPRASLFNRSPLFMFKSTLGSKAEVLMDALGIEEISYKDLDMTINALNKERIYRGLKPLI